MLSPINWGGWGGGLLANSIDSDATLQTAAPGQGFWFVGLEFNGPVNIIKIMPSRSVFTQFAMKILICGKQNK